MKTDLSKAVIYQIYLRTFTSEGTLEATKRMLPHIKDLGIDIIYLSACNSEDSSTQHQSPRQLASGMDNTKNPYRISDYFNIDEEYGTIQDLKDFIVAAHKLELKVLIDLVYLHCAFNAVFLEEHPDFVLRDENGEILTGETWPFARFNYKNSELRKYLHSNMEFYVRDIKADGFRCDVADTVPLDFWAEGVNRVKKINPDVIMLNEGSDFEYLSVFDANYNFGTISALNNLFIDTYEHQLNGRNDSMTPEKFRDEFTKAYAQIPDGKYILVNSENHDSVSDYAEKRPEVYLGTEAAQAVMALVFTMKGIPMIYNGSEVADKLPKNMFWNRFCSGVQSVQWQNALLREGKSRIELVKNLIQIHRTATVSEGDFKWYNGVCDKNVLAYVRETGGEKLTVFVNVGNAAQTVKILDGYSKILLSQNAIVKTDSAILNAYGFLIVESK